MEPHPPPPLDLHRLSLRSVTIATTMTLWRVHRLGREPLFFGSTATHRFDDPSKAYGVLYAGESPRGAFIESVGWNTKRRAVGRDELALRRFVLFRPRRALKVFDLDGPGLRKMGADARLVAGDDYSISRAWSAALHGHPGQADGLRYRARHDTQELSLALFDRCRGDLIEIERRKLSDPEHAAFLAELLDHYSMGLL